MVDSLMVNTLKGKKSHVNSGSMSSAANEMLSNARIATTVRFTVKYFFKLPTDKRYPLRRTNRKTKFIKS